MYYCKDISQLNLQTMKMVMFSSFRGWLEYLAETSENKFQLKLKEENTTIFMSVILSVSFGVIYSLICRQNDTLDVKLTISFYCV